MMIKNGINYGTGNVRVVNIIEHYRNTGTRLRIHYGTPTTGELWGDVETGYVRNSVGPDKVPVLVHNNTSSGGSAILMDNIVRIEFANKKDGGVIFESSPLAFEVTEVTEVATTEFVTTV
jgi:hypothetical protein